jgi:tetratricopeptide (TPR) repeat protein
MSLYAASCVAALAIVQYWNPDLLPNVSSIRVGSTLGNPVLLASYLLLQLGIAAIVAVHNQRRIVGIAGLSGLLSVIALALTEARGTYLGLVAGIVVGGCVWLFLRRSQIAKKRVATLVGTVIVLTVLIAVVITQLSVAAPWTRRLLNTTSLSTRVINWGVAWNGFVARPMNGWGPENYRRVSDALYNPDLSKISYSESYADKPHNQYLELLATSGILGALAGIAVVVLLVRAVVRAYRRGVWDVAMVSVVTGVAVGHGVQLIFLFENPGTYLPVALLIGWVLSLEYTNGEVPRIISHRISAIIAWLCVVLLGAGSIGLSIVPFISAVTTNLGLQYAYDREWESARLYLQKGFAWYTPYAFERWRWSASAVTGMVHVIAPDHKFSSVLVSQRDWLQRDESWARSTAQMVLAASPRSYLLLTTVGKMEYQFGTLHDDVAILEQALHYFREATALSPMREEGYILQAQTLLTLKRPVEATQIMKEARERTGETVLTDWYYGYPLLADPATVDEGLKYVERAIDKQFVFETAAQVEAVTAVLVEKQRFERLVNLYEIVVQQLPNDPLWWSRLALAYQRVDDAPHARWAALRAVEFDPSYRESAEQFLLELDQ